MWSQKRENGSVRYFERYTNYLTGQTKIASVTLKTANSSKAMRELSRKIKAYQDIAPKSESYLTLNRLMEMYLGANKANLKESTYIKKCREFKVLKEILDGKCRADRLNADYCRLKLEGHDPKACTRNERIKHIKALYRWAYQSGTLSNVDWIDRLTYYPDRKKDRIAEKYLERDELAAVIGAMNVQKWKILTEFLVLTGMRIGEALALTPKDVDLSTRMICIDKTYVMELRKVTDPKTYNSYREIYIQDELMDVIREIIPGKKYFFQGEGKPYHYDAYRKYLAETTDKTIGRKLTPHALRHTACSLWAAEGIQWETIARRLGHGADAKVTKEVYFHVTQKLKEKEASAFNSVKMVAEW